MRPAKWIKTVLTEAEATSVFRDVEGSVSLEATPDSKLKSAIAYYTAKRLRCMAMDEWYRVHHTQPPRLAKIARVRRQSDVMTLYWDFRA